MVLAGTKFDDELFEGAIGDAAIDELATDNCVGAHTQTGQTVAGEIADVISWAIAMADIEGVDLVDFVDTLVRIERCDRVFETRRHWPGWPRSIEGHCCARDGGGKLVDPVSNHER